MYPHVLTAALAGQNVAVLDYVEPSLKGKKKKKKIGPPCFLYKMMPVN